MKDTLRLRAISLWKTAQKAENLQAAERHGE